MKKIFIVGDSGSHSVTKAVITALGSCGGVLVCDRGRIYENGSSPDFFVICLSKLSELRCNGGIAVFCRALSGVDSDAPMEGFTAITDAENRSALNILKDKSIPVVGCSVSGCDSLCLSGIDGLYRLISLRRMLPPGAVEPHEFAVRLKKNIPHYALLAACAVLLLCGVDSENGYCF